MEVITFLRSVQNINRLFGQNVEFLNVKPGGKYGNRCEKALNCALPSASHPPSIWYEAVAAPRRKPSGNVKLS